MVDRPNPGFGQYLRGLRERRKLTLEDAANQAALLGERISAAQFSRMENGEALPTLPRLLSLCRLYDVPSAQMIERYEVEAAWHETHPANRTDEDWTTTKEGVFRAMREGRYTESLRMAKTAREALVSRSDPSAASGERELWLLLAQGDCLGHLGFYDTQREWAQQVLRRKNLPLDSELIAYQQYISASYHLECYGIAMAVLRAVQKKLDTPGVPQRMKADFALLAGNLESVMGHLDGAVESYSEAMQAYEALPNAFEACRAQVLLGGALVGLKKHAEAEKLLGQALETSNASGYVRLRAMALGESAVLAFRQDDVARAKKHAIESNEIARQLGFDALCFRNTWYLRQLAEQAGDTGLVASYTQTLKVYLSKTPGHMPEAEAFRALEASSEKGGAK